MTVQVVHLYKEPKIMFTYETDIEPHKDDLIDSNAFKDGLHRVISYRLLLPAVPNFIVVYVDFLKPNK